MMAQNNEPPEIKLPEARDDVLVVTGTSLTTSKPDGGHITLYAGDRVRGRYYLSLLKGQPGIAVETTLVDKNRKDPEEVRRNFERDRLIRIGAFPSDLTIRIRRESGVEQYPGLTDIPEGHFDVFTLESDVDRDHPKVEQLASSEEVGAIGSPVE